MKNMKQSVVSSNLATALESIRFEKAMSKTQFATLGGVTGSYYSQIIKQKQIPNINTLQRFCNNIGVPLIVVIIKATFEDKDCLPEKRRLVREIKPLIEKAIEILHCEKKEAEEVKKTK